MTTTQFSDCASTIRRNKMTGAIYQFSGAILQILDETVLDCGSAIRDAIDMIYLISKVDDDHPRCHLLDQMVARIVPGIGWLEYAQQVIPKSGSNRYDTFLKVRKEYPRQFDHIGLLFLAILRFDLKAFRRLFIQDLTKACQELKLMFWTAASKAFHPEIFRRLHEQLCFDLDRKKLRRELTHAIDQSDLGMITMITVGCSRDVRGIETKYRNELFMRAWHKYVTVDPECNECKIMSAMCVCWTSDGDNGSEVDAIKLVNMELNNPRASGPLLWMLEHHPDIFWYPNILIFCRWKLKDRLTLLTAMKQLDITREQLMEWYDDYESICTQLESVCWIFLARSLIPKKADLDLEWIASILSKKSARSAIEPN